MDCPSPEQPCALLPGPEPSEEWFRLFPSQPTSYPGSSACQPAPVAEHCKLPRSPVQTPEASRQFHQLQTAHCDDLHTPPSLPAAARESAVPACAHRRRADRSQTKPPESIFRRLVSSAADDCHHAPA